jgi:hypothetical protein
VIVQLAREPRTVFFAARAAARRQTPQLFVRFAETHFRLPSDLIPFGDVGHHGEVQSGQNVRDRAKLDVAGRAVAGRQPTFARKSAGSEKGAKQVPSLGGCFVRVHVPDTHPEDLIPWVAQ